MDAKELVNQLALHPLIQAELPLQMQLGWPYLEKRQDTLLMSFKPHKEAYQNGSVAFFAQQFEVAFVYPFEHIALFRNLTMEAPVDVSAPVCIIPADQMLSGVAYAIEELYEQCSRALTFQARDGRVSDLVMDKYQKLYHQTAEKFGLEALYG